MKTTKNLSVGLLCLLSLEILLSQLLFFPPLTFIGVQEMEGPPYSETSSKVAPFNQLLVRPRKHKRLPSVKAQGHGNIKRHKGQPQREDGTARDSSPWAHLSGAEVKCASEKNACFG